ncbi:pentapeptide repeat-containing protein [Legionella spiritensis]|uniref:Pentapeptide repeat-containing protein n=1 Tax=Legionella spiritensis TaxID=452 RepID=A0A0W0Z8R5_LEGSP|nr:pentapeptide repeat-containing protein [Legionella spiritensis]KTD65495.1 hypothetical protein Lspi_0569 [Legionella spiritensis]SNV35923.1 Uncharacterised protein [Legionella spiritensis]
MIFAVFQFRPLIVALICFLPQVLFGDSASDYSKLNDYILNSPKILPTQNFSEKKVIADAVTINSTIINKPVFYSNTRFLNNVSISTAYVEEPLDIRLSHFKGSIYLDNLVTRKSVIISWNFFENNVKTYRAILQKAGLFKSNHFLEEAVFYKMKCLAICNFSLSKFYKTADFTGSTFEGNARFNSVIFNGDVSFEGATFSKKVSFTRSIFDKKVNFHLANFNGGLDLSNASFKNYVNLKNTAIDGVLNLSNIQVTKGIIDLSTMISANQKKKIQLNIIGTNVSKLHLRYDNFSLYFPPTTSYQQKESTYTALMQHFKKNGLTQSYERLYKEFYSMKYQHQNQYLRGVLSGNFWDYGLNPSKALQWFGLMFLLFTIINAMFYLKLTKDYCTIPFLEKVNTSNAEDLNPVMRFIYFLPHAFILTLFLFGGTFLKFGNISSLVQSRNLFIITYLLLITITGYLSLFYILAIIVRGA